MAARKGVTSSSVQRIDPAVGNYVERVDFPTLMRQAPLRRTIINAILSIGDIMTYQAIIQREIETLPPQYYDEVVDFIGYLRHKAQQTTTQASFLEQNRAREKEPKIIR